VAGRRNVTVSNLRLVIDTATRRSVVALGRGSEVIATSERESPHRHGQTLLEQIDEALENAGAGRREIDAIGVGIGPGSFTGLRVGLATAKTLAYLLDAALCGITTSDALARAADAGAASAAIVLPAGAHDVYLAVPGSATRLVPPGADLAAELREHLPIAVDMAAGSVSEEARERGAAAVRGLPAALLAILDERLVAGRLDAPEDLVPAYVALPRGISAPIAETAWSPDLR
jgi:tRNA threonylcarbamoyladenosine biosynthesis protein TsaB